MYIVYYHTSCAVCRQVKLFLHYSKVDYKTIYTQYWKKEGFRPQDIYYPTVINNKVGSLVGHYAILEYFFSNLMSQHIVVHEKDKLNEMRRLLYLANDFMNRDVCVLIVYERLIRMLTGQGSPDLQVLKKARTSLHYYLSYFSYLIDQRTFVLHDKMSVVDFAMAAQISILDYLNEINWCKYNTLAAWYRIIKSLPSFREILKDKLEVLVQPKHYSKLDF